MKRIIQQKLSEIEKIHDIQILYSCESGSRAWGFPSPDSDYDVRFIYIRPIEKYLTVQRPKDHLSFAITDELDIYGWDISKVLHLLTKSNTTPFEWLQSPILYRENEALRNELWQLCQNYFCARSNMHHYLGIARSAMDTMQGREIKIKKLFYVLRPMLSALWNADRNAIAPMNIEPLMELLTDDIRNKVLSLIELKSTVGEGYQIEIDSSIKEWIDHTFDYCMQASAQMERKTFDSEIADHFFRKMILK